MSTRHEPNQPITLATTKIVEVDGQTVDVLVEVILRLLPNPILVIESKQLPNIVLTKERFYISLANGAKFEAMRRSFNFLTGEGSLVPAHQPVDVLDKGLSLRSVHFGIVNFPAFYGNQDIWRDDKQSSIRIPHVRLPVPDWSVEITGVLNIGDVERTLGQEKGYGVTYEGSITRSDLTGFSAKDVERLLRTLRSFLSFARGATCTLALVEGLDHAAQPSWLRWGMHHVEPWGNYHSWFRRFDGTETLSTLFSRFWHLSESDNGDNLLRAIDWYLQSNVSPPYIGIILTVAALELLSGQVLKRERETDGTEQTGHYINEALEELGIPSHLPEGYQALRKIKNWEHSPHATVAIRNDFIHPRPKLRDVSNYAIHEAWNLGQWCIEMMLLRMLEHQGDYQNRLATWHERDQAFVRVPWVK